MITLERLKVFYTKSDRHIVAKVDNGKRVFTFKFGRTCSMKHMNAQIPRLVADADFEERVKLKRKKVVSHVA